MVKTAAVTENKVRYIVTFVYTTQGYNNHYFESVLICKPSELHFRLEALKKHEEKNTGRHLTIDTIEKSSRRRPRFLGWGKMYQDRKIYRG